MAHLLADEDLKGNLVRALRDLGHEIVRVQDANAAGWHDPDVFSMAIRLDRVFVTHNRYDYACLHRSGISHPGIIAVAQRMDAETGANLINDLLEAEPNLRGRFFSLNRPPMGLSEVLVPKK